MVRTRLLSGTPELVPEGKVHIKEEDREGEYHLCRKSRLVGQRSRPHSHSFPGFVDLVASRAPSQDSSWFCPKDVGLPGRQRINGMPVKPWGGQDASWKCKDVRFPAKSLTSRLCLRCSWRRVTDSIPRTVPVLLLTPCALRAVQR